MRKTNNIMFDSCIFEGRVFHNRVYPKSHYFKYKMFCIYFDLCKIKEIFKKIPILSINKFNFFSFYENDHGPIDCNDLEKWIKETLRASGIREKVVSIFLLAYPRVLGYVFNPLSVYTCFNKDKKIVAQVYEVHNTFKQRHFYITANTFQFKNHRKEITKEFFVSPFMGMKGKYRFKSYFKNKNLSIFIEFLSKKEKLIASFTAEKKSLTNLRLILNFFRYPLMTLKVILGIHFEALFLYIKGLKVFKCPEKSDKSVSSYLREKK